MTALSTPKPAAESDPADFPDIEHPPLAVGDTVHFLAAVALCVSDRLGAPGIMQKFGSEFVVTQEFLNQNPPTQAGSLWALIDDPQGQVRRYGHEVVRRGPRPEGVLRTEPGSPEHDAARKRLEAAAWASHGHHGPEAYEEIALVRAVYGQPEPTNRSVAIR